MLCKFRERERERASSKSGAAAGAAKKPEITDGAPRWCRRSPKKKNIFVSFRAAANARAPGGGSSSELSE